MKGAAYFLLIVCKDKEGVSKFSHNAAGGGVVIYSKI